MVPTPLRFTILLTALLPIAAFAQQPATGTVTGHVICADTQRPARFAQVTLFGMPTEITQRPKLDPNADEATQMAAMKDAMASFKQTNIATALTDLNGAYTANNIAPRRLLRLQHCSRLHYPA
jgi:signal recognition particle GTPase